jgi:uncharacterized protein YqeY
MRAKDSERLGTIRLLLAACKQKEVDERVTLDDAVIGIIDKLVKQRKDSITAFAQAGRMDLADKETAELAVLQAYLPQRMDAAAGPQRHRRPRGHTGERTGSQTGRRRHGSRDGPGQDATGRQGRHGPGLGRCQGGIGGLITQLPAIFILPSRIEPTVLAP